MKILILKDIKLSIRCAGVLLIFLTLIGFLPICLFFANTYNPYQDIEITIEYMRMCIIMCPAMQMPLIGTLIFQVTLNEDRKNQALQTLIADGIKQEKLWINKLLTSIIISYFLSLISIVMSYIVLFLITGKLISFDFTNILFSLIIIPIISIAVLSLTSLIIWSSKQGQMIAGFIPFVCYMLCIYLYAFQLDNKNIFQKNIIYIAAVPALLFSLFCFGIVKKISNEHIVNLQI